VLAGEDLLCRIVDTAAYTREHLEMFQRAVNSDLKRELLYTENHGGYFERL
jgi:hypothetical protein